MGIRTIAHEQIAPRLRFGLVLGVGAIFLVGQL